MLGSPPDPQRSAPCPRGENGAAPAAGPGGHLDGLDLAGTTLERVLHVGDKSLLVSGHHGGRPVVVKVLTTEEQFWRDNLAHEIAVHRALARAPAPARTPELVHTDGGRLLVTEQLPGRPLDRERYPRRALPEAEVSAAITAVSDFAAWAPPVGALAPVFDYRDRLIRYRWCLDDTGSTMLYRLLDRLGAPTVAAHGDPLPTNLLVTPTTAEPGPAGGRGVRCWISSTPGCSCPGSTWRCCTPCWSRPRAHAPGSDGSWQRPGSGPRSWSTARSCSPAN